MGKITKEEQARRDGISYAVRRIKESGMEEFEKELERRRISCDMPIAVDMKACKQWETNMRRQVISCILVMSCCVLQDEFDLGEEEIKRFIERFNDRSENILLDYADWDTYLEQLRDELNVELDIFKNDRTVEMRGRV